MIILQFQGAFYRPPWTLSKQMFRGGRQVFQVGQAVSGPHRNSTTDHRPTIHGLGHRGFRGPVLSKIKEMCRHIVCLTKRVKKCFGLLPVLCICMCLLKREAVVTVASYVAPQNILDLGPLKAWIRPWVLLLGCRATPVEQWEAALPHLPRCFRPLVPPNFWKMVVPVHTSVISIMVFQFQL